MRGPATGRADLVRVLPALGEGGLETAARLLGLLPRPGPAIGAGAPARLSPREQTVEVEAVSPPPDEALAWSQSRLGLYPVPLLLPVEVEHSEVEGEAGDEDVELVEEGELAPSGSRPALEPLAPWSRLAPSLEEALEALLPSLQVDTDEAVRLLSRGRRLERLPLRRLAYWASRLVVVRDHSDRLTPYWDDQDLVAHQLRRLLGQGGVHVATLAHGPGSPFLDGGPQAAWPGAVPVLALSDLGLLAGEEERRRWLRWGHELQARGHRLTALVPVPPERWAPPLRRLWRPLWWDRGSQAQRLRRVSPWGSGEGRLQAQGGQTGPEGERVVLRRLLTLVSFTLVLEPGLLRAVRRLLPAAEADASLEGEAWTHWALRARPASGAAFHPAAAAELRRELAREDPHLVRQVLAEVLAWHRAHFREVANHERVILSRLCPGVLSGQELREVDELARRLHRTVLVHARDDPQGRGHEYGGWFRRLEPRLPAQVWQEDDNLGDGLVNAWVAVHQKELDAGHNPDPPEGVRPHQLAQARARLSGRRPTPRPWEARQVGGELHLLPCPEPGDFTPRTGSLLGELTVGEPFIRVRQGASRWRFLPLQAATLATLPLTGAEPLEMESDHTRLRLELWTRPPHGPWRAAGRDRFGVWAQAEVGDVAFRMRWIAPGRFLMGSPEGEEGRYDDEGPQHTVTLIEGFWLAETPVTQALWKAVTQANPSRFKTPDRPVEGVSWDDCQRFIRTLNRQLPGLDARLPTEAEWEYACRAGTETSTYAGELEIRGAGDAPLLDTIAWYGGNSGGGYELEEGADSSDWPEKQYDHRKAGTRPVAQKEPNRWGLYDMLGNVWEWCEDGQRDYEAVSVVNPFGPRSKGARRVLRGGSWLDGARSVRSACRSWLVPGFRHVYLGLRLARGQGGTGRSQDGGGDDGARVAAEPPEKRSRVRRRRAPDGPKIVGP